MGTAALARLGFFCIRVGLHSRRPLSIIAAVRGASRISLGDAIRDSDTIRDEHTRISRLCRFGRPELRSDLSDPGTRHAVQRRVTHLDIFPRSQTFRLTSHACFIGKWGVACFRCAAGKRAMGPASLLAATGMQRCVRRWDPFERATLT